MHVNETLNKGVNINLQYKTRRGTCLISHTRGSIISLNAIMSG